MRLWTDDIVSLQPGRDPVVGREANADVLREGMRQSAGMVPLAYDFAFREVTTLGDHAVEWGTFSGAMLAPTGDTLRLSGTLLRVLRKENGEWRVARTAFSLR